MPHSHVKSATRKNARRMRKSMTDAELRFWNAVRAHRLMGLGFRRQMPVSGYIVDFACPDHRLIVELDGSGHTDDAQIRKDAVRDRELESLGWKVLRLPNQDVMFRLDYVCSHVIRLIGVDHFVDGRR